MAEFWRNPFTKAEMQAMRRSSTESETIAPKLWRLVRTVGRNLPFAEDALTMFYCATDPKTSRRTKTIILGAIAYFVLPFDIIPDFLPIIGFTDDAAVIAAALSAVHSEISDDHRRRAREALLDIEKA